MDQHEAETEKKIERSDMSVDQILDEYWARVAEEARRAQERDYGLSDDYDSADPLPDGEPEDADEDGVRIYRPGAAAAPRGWNGEGDFDLVYESTPQEQPPDDSGEDWYEEDEEEPYRPLSARDILREYWTNNAPSYKVELPEEPEAEVEPEAEEADEDADMAVYMPMSVRDILKEYWNDNAASYVPDGERAPEAAVIEAEEEAPTAAAPQADEPAPPEEETPLSVRDILTEYWLHNEPEANAEAQAPPEPEPEIEPEPESEPAPAYEPEAESEAEDEAELSYERLRARFAETARQDAPIAEPEPEAERESAGAAPAAAYIYSEAPELTVRDILTEYWTSGESEPIQDAQLRAEEDAARAAMEETEEEDAAAELEQTVYQNRHDASPQPSAGEHSPPSAEDYRQAAEDLGLTVDNILSEYWAAAQRPASPPARRDADEAPAPAYEEERADAAEEMDLSGLFAAAEDAAAESAADTAAVGAAVGAAAVTAAAAVSGETQSAVSAMADEARRFIAELEGTDFAQLRDEADYDSARRVTPTRRVDPRFDLGGRSRRTARMTFGGKEVDLSADENYVPPTAVSVDAPTQWDDADESGEYTPRQDPKWFTALKNWGVVKKSGKRPLNAPVTDYDPYGLDAAAPEPEDAPEESAPEEARRPVPEETVVFDSAAFAAAQEQARAEEPDEEPEFDFGAHLASSRIEDTAAAPADYAPEKDYAADYDPALDGIDLENDNFPSFGQYLMSLITGSLIRVRGLGDTASAGTMEEDDEELGPELSPANASRYYGAHVRTLRLRFRIALVLLAVMAWLTLGLPVPGMLKTFRVCAAMCLGLQLTVMLLSLDVVTNAAVNLARGRFGADSLACLACVLTSLDALSVAVGGFGHAHTPLCLLSSLSLLGVLYSSLLSARGLRKALRVPAIGKRCYAVTGELNVKGKDITLLKSVRPATGFVRRCEEAPPDEALFTKLSPFLLLGALLLTAAVALVKKSGSDFLYILTALLCPAVPVTALLCFALPYCLGSLRIFSSGAAVAGWSGISDIGRSQNLIVTDRDLFPEGSIELESVRIFADAPAEKIISYAGTMITASGSGIAHCFGELMEKNGGSMRRVENFEYLPGGGMKGIIAGETVLCGSTDLMRLMNVRIPFRLVSRNSVLLAIDGVLYGIFNIAYSAQPQVRDALIGLIRSNRHPIFAIRDFNISPETLHSIFDVATDGYDFPPYIERFSISEAKPAKESKIAAVVCREGLGPLVHMADTGRSMYVATNINLLVAVLAAVVNLLAVFVTLLGASYVSAAFLLLMMLLWVLPVLAVSVFLRF